MPPWHWRFSGSAHLVVRPWLCLIDCITAVARADNKCELFKEYLHSEPSWKSRKPGRTSCIAICGQGGHMRIGYLGVGNMGQPMAGKLLDAGHELWIYDIREDAMRPLLERQARQATSVTELADNC